MSLSAAIFIGKRLFPEAASQAAVPGALLYTADSSRAGARRVLPAGEAFQIYHIWQCLFPVEAGHYWFVTAYVVMYLFSPVLNAAAGGHDAEAAADYAHGTADLFQPWEKREASFYFIGPVRLRFQAGSFSFI